MLKRNLKKKKKEIRQTNKTKPDIAKRALANIINEIKASITID